MVMTLTVQLHIDTPTQLQGGYLLAEPFTEVYEELESFDHLCDQDIQDFELNACSAPHEPNHLQVSLFYHDIEHMVTKVRKGYRASFICDIVRIESGRDGIQRLFFHDHPDRYGPWRADNFVLNVRGDDL